MLVGGLSWGEVFERVALVGSVEAWWWRSCDCPEFGYELKLRNVDILMPR